jgi:hypothetical protein
MPSVWSGAPIIIDEPTEIPVILGETIVGRHEKWLWPPDDVFRTWTGKWNKDYENCFQVKWSAIQSEASHSRTRIDRNWDAGP